MFTLTNKTNRTCTIFLVLILITSVGYCYIKTHPVQQFFHSGYSYLTRIPNHGSVAPDLEGILNNGHSVLKQTDESIKEHFKTNQKEAIYEINRTPIKAILKIENSGTHYYAIYDYLLGKGSYSQVLLAQDIYTKELLAVKVQPYSIPEDIEHEIKHLSIINEYRGDAIIVSKQEKTHYLFCKLAKGVALDKLYADSLNYSEKDILNIIIASFEALEALHKQNVVHNDIHEGNLVYNSRDKKAQWVDMAFSLKLKSGEEFFSVSRNKEKKPPCYKAPESNSERGYSTDVYQLGFMSLRQILILSEQDRNLRKKYIDSREESFDAIHKKYQAISSDTTPTSKIYNVLFRMIASTKSDRPTLQAAINELKLYADAM